MERKKFSIKLNSTDKVEQLLQETYDLASQQSKQIQDEINKIVNTTILNNLDIDGKEKYGKIMNNYLSLLQKATSQKMDIAKLMAEVIKHNGDVNGALDASKKGINMFDTKAIRDMVRNATSTNESVNYELKGK